MFRDEQKKIKKRKKLAKSTLSFAVDDEAEDDSTSKFKDEEDDNPSKRVKTRKNPNVDTSFLPDRDREEAERREREELRQEWLRKQEEMKKEEIEITYSYWDGSGHRKSVTVCFRMSCDRTCVYTDKSDTRMSSCFLNMNMNCSVRKETTSRRSSRSAGSNSRNCGA